MKQTLSIIIILLLLIASFFLGKSSSVKIIPKEVQRDTITLLKYDTVLVDKPVLKTVEIIRHDTLLTEYWHLQHDTIIAVDVPIERKVYAEDSLYRAVVSGWHPQLDSLSIYPTITTITIREKVKTPPPKLSLGVTAGPSALVTPKGHVHAGIGATVGLQYRF